MIEKRLLTRIQEKKARLDGLRPLPASAVRRLNEQLNIEWIYNSNAIEGSTLTLRETQLILEQGITIGGKRLREHFEVINHQEAIHLVESLTDKQAAITAFHVRRRPHHQPQKMRGFPYVKLPNSLPTVKNILAYWHGQGV